MKYKYATNSQEKQRNGNYGIKLLDKFMKAWRQKGERNSEFQRMYKVFP